MFCKVKQYQMLAWQDERLTFINLQTDKHIQLRQVNQKDILFSYI